MSAKRFRLWIDAKGAPLYVELLNDYSPTVETVQQIAATIEEALANHKPVILGPDWEIRVVAA